VIAAAVVTAAALFTVVRWAFLLIELPVTEVLRCVVIELDDAIIIRNCIGRLHWRVSRAVVVHIRDPLRAAAFAHHPFS